MAPDIIQSGSTGGLPIDSVNCSINSGGKEISSLKSCKTVTVRKLYSNHPRPCMTISHGNVSLVILLSHTHTHTHTHKVVCTSALYGCQHIICS
ncbi:hypothetical protein HanRHA438_Chr01g0011121 [Helianthus annuus]|nr:hypothetical protein HanRHA438_Chr01g0011121 [Helianthus annuus]